MLVLHNLVLVATLILCGNADIAFKGLGPMNITVHSTNYAGVYTKCKQKVS